jgi:hypothetical protein
MQKRARLIDDVVLVGTPQEGSPNTIGGLLFGYGQGISAFHGIGQILSTAAARDLARTLPAAFELLPSRSYFDSVHDAAHPAILLTDQSSFTDEFKKYGATITTWQNLASFLAGRGLGQSLLDGANTSHASLDAWTPPAGVTVYQIAGWGDESTLAGIEFYDRPKLGGLLGFTPSYKPITTEDGDGLVPVPSALLMGENSSPRYWFNLAAYAKQTGTFFNHSQELAIPEMQDFIERILAHDHSLPSYFSTVAPDPIDHGAQLRFTLHGTGSLRISDADGNVTGTQEGGTMSRSIPDSFFGTLGDLFYVLVPKLGTYTLSVLGADADAALDQETVVDGTVTESSSNDAPDEPVTVVDGVPETENPPEDTDTPQNTDPNSGGSTNASGQPVTGYSDAGSTGGGFVTPNVIIPKQTSTKTPAKPKVTKPKTTKTKTSSTSPTTKQTTTPSTQPAAAYASLSDSIRSAISAMLAEIYTLVSSLAQLLTSLLAFV